MTVLAQGRILLWQGGSLWVFDVPVAAAGHQPRTDFHSHHAIQITLALDGQFDLYVGDRRYSGPAVVVAADVRHAFQPAGQIALVFVEPESSAGRRLSSTLLGEEPAATIEDGSLRDQCALLSRLHRSQDVDLEALRRVGHAVIGALAGDRDTPAPDERIQEAIAWASSGLDRRLSVSEAARNAGLSVDRMSHLFVEQTGLPFRTYLLWLRLTLAVECVASGASLTEAAHQAGFADSAHFSRTFRRMFGVAAASLRLV